MMVAPPSRLAGVDCELITVLARLKMTVTCTLLIGCRSYNNLWFTCVSECHSVIIIIL